MNLIKTLIAVLTFGSLAMTAYASNSEKAAQTEKSENMKAVIVYFTHSGNTELAAKELAAVTCAPVVRLMPAEPYSSADVDWTDESSRCTLEHLDQSLRPGIGPVDIDFDSVDTVFIGFPIWWHEEPAIIRTFLDQYHRELEGKVLYPFCTSYESPMSEADANLQKGYPSFNWKTGLRLPADKKLIEKWIKP